MVGTSMIGPAVAESLLLYSCVIAEYYSCGIAKYYSSGEIRYFSFD